MARRDDTEGEGEHLPKRRKVAESCKPCRAKKTRCDGQRPVCSPCRAKAVSCEYNHVTIPIPAVTLTDINSRLQRLEQQLAERPTSPPALLNVQTLPSSTAMARPARTVSFQRPSDITTNDMEAGAPFGDSSSRHFMMEITRLVGDQAATGQKPASWSHAGCPYVETDMASMVLPEKSTADNLFECYVRYVQPAFHILHIPSFRKIYEGLWLPQQQQQHDSLAQKAAFFATLNIVFALGCLNYSDVEPHFKLNTANGFYQRARVLLPLDALDLPSLEVVQCLLLTTLYLSYTPHSDRCFNTLSVAVRVAQSLGLHTDCEGASRNQLKREMSRRVWYQCVALDRLFASRVRQMALLQNDSNVPLPACIDDDYLLGDGEGSQPPGTPSTIDSFIAMIKIFQVVGEAWKVHSGKPPGLGLPDLGEIIRLNGLLDEVCATLPSHLRMHDDQEPLDSPGGTLKLQAYIVSARILYTRLFILRPTVLAAARRSTTPCDPPGAIFSPIELTLRTEMLALCLQTAASTIRIMHANLHSAVRIFSSNVVSVTVAAATVIIAASLVAELDVNLEDDNGVPYKGLICAAFEVLTEYQWQFDGARDAKEQLEIFMRLITRAKNRDMHNQEQSTDNGGVGESMAPDGRDGGLGSADPDHLWDIDWGLVTPFLGNQDSYFNF